MEAAEPLPEAADADVVAVADAEVAEQAKAFAASGCCNTTVFLPRFPRTVAPTPPCPASVIFSFVLPTVCVLKLSIGLAVLVDEILV